MPARLAALDIRSMQTFGSSLERRLTGQRRIPALAVSAALSLWLGLFAAAAQGLELDTCTIDIGSPDRPVIIRDPACIGDGK